MCRRGRARGSFAARHAPTPRGMDGRSMGTEPSLLREPARQVSAVLEGYVLEWWAAITFVGTTIGNRTPFE